MDAIKLYIATPAYGGMLHVGYLSSLLNLRASGLQFLYDVIGNESLIQRARNLMVARFLQSESTHLLFIDSDIIFPVQAVQRLLQGASQGREVVATAYAKKSFKWDKFHEKLKNGTAGDEQWQSLGIDYNINIDPKTAKIEEGFLRVLDTATGFMMISRKVIEKLIAAHPEWEVVNDIEHSGGPKVDKYFTVFDCIKDPVTSRLLSEDYGAVRRLQEIGVDVWVDLSVGLTHCGNNAYYGCVTDQLKATKKRKPESGNQT